MKLISYGAAEVVTGSCHYLETKNNKFLVDCGMFQGKNEEKNYENWDFDASEIDFVLITHGHLDHVGRLPLLYKMGFRGVIYTTKATIDIARVVLYDAANLMEEDYITRHKKALRKGQKARKPLYTAKDVREMFKNIEFVDVEYNKKIKVAKKIQVIFKDAGHILGSAMIKITINENSKKILTFSGDLGNRYNDVLPAPAVIKKTDYLFCESTYGDRNHKSFKETIKEFRKEIISTLNNNGNVIIPSFAIERTQEVLCALKDMYKEGLLPKGTQIFLDSPMAIKATNVYLKYHKKLSQKCNKYLKKDGEIFEFDIVKYTTKVDQSKKINNINKKAIIIAGSGMCNGGRILHHLKNRIWDKNNTILFVGYQAEGTLGREIVNGEKWIKIYGEDILVQAKVVTINGFSAHADQNELLSWIKPMKKSIKSLFLIHGEKEKQKIFKQKIIEKFDLKVHIVEPKEVIGL
jgi:metallo-beta-lactamase family protein